MPPNFPQLSWSCRSKARVEQRLLVLASSFVMPPLWFPLCVSCACGFDALFMPDGWTTVALSAPHTGDLPFPPPPFLPPSADGRPRRASRTSSAATHFLHPPPPEAHRPPRLALGTHAGTTFAITLPVVPLPLGGLDECSASSDTCPGFCVCLLSSCRSVFGPWAVGVLSRCGGWGGCETSLPCHVSSKRRESLRC